MQIVSFVAIIILACGMYLLWIVLAAPFYMSPHQEKWNKPVEKSVQKITEDRLYIPTLKLNLAFKSGDASVLDFNVWHRFPERGDPEKGGNFILAGHRFEMAPTPGEVIRKSPFYNIDKLIAGDKIYVDFKGKRYEYSIIEKITVKPTQLEIESPSEEPKMTLYTCTLGGTTDGREVIIAHVVAKDIDPARAP